MEGLYHSSCHTSSKTCSKYKGFSENGISVNPTTEALGFHRFSAKKGQFDFFSFDDTVNLCNIDAKCCQKSLNNSNPILRT